MLFLDVLFEFFQLEVSLKNPFEIKFFLWYKDSDTRSIKPNLLPFWADFYGATGNFSIVSNMSGKIIIYLLLSFYNFDRKWRCLIPNCCTILDVNMLNSIRKTAGRI